MRAFGGNSGGGVKVWTEPWLTSWKPTGWTACLVGESATSDIIDYSGATALPAAIDSKAVVGCDRRLKPGKSSVDFTRRNSPGFDKLARRLTNGSDDMLFTETFTVDKHLIPYGMGGGGCPESCRNWQQPVVDKQGKRGAADLKGFKIDRIRLKVRDANWKIEPNADGYWLSYQFNYRWEIYGHKA